MKRKALLMTAGLMIGGIAFSSVAAAQGTIKVGVGLQIQM